jgi:peptidoglycan/xylan/chitin deacetylase (PgdA/CDA1 family)
LWLATGARVNPGLRILFYHRVSNDRDELAVTPRNFEAQMQALADTGYRVLDVAGAVDDPQPRTLGLSFDDGYADVAEHALPVLERHGFRATVFVATGVTDGHAKLEWYDRQPALISWDEIAQLDGGAFTFGAHTVTHANLPALGEAEARREITDSRRELEERLGREVDLFCYPAGLFGDRERRLVAEAGFRLAVSTEPGPNAAATDRLALRRNQVDARDTLLDFRAKVAGAHDRPLPGRTLYRRLRYSASSRS